MTYVATELGLGSHDRIVLDEMYANIRLALSWGYNDREAARYARCSDRTVARYRRRHGIESTYDPMFNADYGRGY